jgi:hypothetical protein
MFSKAMVDHQALQPEPSNPPPPAFKPPQNTSRRSQPYHDTLALKELLYDTKLKLEEFSASTSSTMDPSGGHHGGNRTGQGGHYGYDPKGHGGYPGVFDGMLPRIETRGQSRGGRSKYEDKGKSGGKR